MRVERRRRERTFVIKSSRVCGGWSGCGWSEEVVVVVGDIVGF